MIDSINSDKLSNLKNKRVYDENYDFIVNTDQAVMITNGNYHSLTFHVYRLVDNDLTENLVLSWYNGKYYPALYIYNFTAEEKQKVKNNVPFLLTKKIERKLLENFDVGTVARGVICTTTTTSITVECSQFKHGAYNFGKWPECEADVKPLQIVISSTDCNETWVNGGVFYIANPGIGGGGGGNPNYNPNMPPYNPGNGVPIALGHITRPFLSLATPEQTFYNQLSQDQKSVMNVRVLRTGILKVLQLNSYSPASQQLAKDVCDFYIETGNTSLANKILTLAKTDVESAQQIINYLSNEGNSEASQTFANTVLNFLSTHPGSNGNYILNNKTDFDSNQREVDNYQAGGYDNTTYSHYSAWPTVAPVIQPNNFVGWGAPGVARNCMDYAKAQIAEAGYQISSYLTSGQTFQIYTLQNGVNNVALSDGLDYLKYALSNGIPVIVGVDDAAGSPNIYTDNTTDHFIVIVGMGTNFLGNYLQFYDNADSQVSKGTSNLNLLYYNSSTGLITGTSQTDYAQGLTYTVTMIRKSKQL